MVNQIRTSHPDETQATPDSVGIDLNGEGSSKRLEGGANGRSPLSDEPWSTPEELAAQLDQADSNQDADQKAERLPSGTAIDAGADAPVGLGQGGSGPLPASSAQTMKNRSWLSRWFWNLPIGRKQLLALVICELVPILGLGVGATWIILQNLRQQLVERAESEVEIAQIEYRIKMDQMAFGSRGQSDNSLLVNAALDSLEGFEASPEGKASIKQVLNNEIKARQIEYATLVGADLRIIAGGNRDRAGETFDPDGLVSLALRQARQVKASEIAARSELEREGAPLPQGLELEEDLLTRYIVTPIFDPRDPEQTIGALVFGDVVNGKFNIPGEVLQALDNGYSAVYQRNDEGEFALSTSVQAAEGQLTAEEFNIPVETADLLFEEAVESPGETFVERLSINGLPYTVAVRAEPSRIYTDYSQSRRNVPVYESDATHAILVHGTPETSLNQLLRRSLSQELVVLCLSAGLITAWTLLFRRTVLKPLQNLSLATQAFAEGDRQSRAEVEAYDEVGQLAIGFNDMADSITASEQSLADEASRQQLQAHMARQLNNLTTQMRASRETADILPIAVKGLREVLAADRVVIYQLNPDGSGTIAAESVLPTWRSILGQEMTDPCFAEQYIEKYRQGRVHAIDDIHGADLEQCYQDELAPFEVRANLVVPVVTNDELLGLLCIHQCSGPRNWQEQETSFAQQSGIQLGYALEQADLAQAQLRARQTAEDASVKERQQNEKLQLQLIDLLSDVESVADGDLTARADVSEGALGTVADFFNSIVENLRQVVAQVQTSSVEVNRSVDSSEGEIRQLSQDALRQSEQLDSALQSVEQMSQSIQAVATSASQAAKVSQTAADTAVAGGQSMDRTVDNILTLRETIGETAKKVKRLGESSQQISKEVYLINQIAMQTNLLAINAGI